MAASDKVEEPGRRRRDASPSYVIIRLEQIDAADHGFSREQRHLQQEYRKSVAAEVDDLGETLHRIATNWRRGA